MRGLVRLLGQDKLLEYPRSDGVFWLKDSGERKDILKGLVPPHPLVEFWEHSNQSAEDWEVCKSLYMEVLQSTEAKKDLMYLYILAERGKTCNVVCGCYSSDKCIRSLVFDALAGMQASVFLD